MGEGWAAQRLSLSGDEDTGPESCNSVATASREVSTGRDTTTKGGNGLGVLFSLHV